MSLEETDPRPTPMSNLALTTGQLTRAATAAELRTRLRRSFRHQSIARPDGPPVPLSRLLAPEGANGTYAGKRLIDAACGGAAFALLLPIMALVWVMVRLTSPGPGVIWSERVGRFGRMFRMPKFRSMRIDAPLVPREELPDPHLYDTPVGLFLRKTSLDELPQLWSVFIGDMSLVGPRPLIRQDVAMHYLRAKAGVYRARPGITGLAQVNGRNLVQAGAKVALDEKYIERASLWLDLVIALKTVLVMARPSAVFL